MDRQKENGKRKVSRKTKREAISKGEDQGVKKKDLVTIVTMHVKNKMIMLIT